MKQEQINYYRNLIADKGYMDRAAREMAARYVDNFTKPIQSTREEVNQRYDMSRSRTELKK